MPAPRRLTAALLPLLLLPLGACSGDEDGPPAQDEGPMATALQPGAPGEANSVVTAVQDSQVMGEVTAADVEFLEHMVVHHAQAVELVGLAESELADEEVAAMAGRIRAAQLPEITTMARWLAQEGRPVPVQAQEAGVDVEALGGEVAGAGSTDPDGDHDGHDGHGADGHGGHGDDHAGTTDGVGGAEGDLAGMPGMATPGQLDALGAAQGRDAEVLFLELMIAHHEGALAMTTTQAAEGEHVLISEMADEMFVEQQAEIARMQEIRDRLQQG